MRVCSDQRELETIKAASAALCDSEVRDMVLEELSGLRRVHEEKERAMEAGLAVCSRLIYKHALFVFMPRLHVFLIYVNALYAAGSRSRHSP